MAKKTTTKRAARKGQKEMTQIHGRADEVNSLEDLFPIFRKKSTVSAKSAEDYRAVLEGMFPVDLQNHAIEEHGIIPWDVSTLQGKNRMINTCVKEWQKKHATGAPERKKKLSNNAQRTAAQIFKSYGLS